MGFGGRGRKRARSESVASMHVRTDRGPGEGDRRAPPQHPPLLPPQCPLVTVDQYMSWYSVYETHVQSLGHLDVPTVRGGQPLGERVRAGRRWLHPFLCWGMSHLCTARVGAGHAALGLPPTQTPPASSPPHHGTHSPGAPRGRGRGRDGGQHGDQLSYPVSRATLAGGERCFRGARSRGVGFAIQTVLSAPAPMHCSNPRTRPPTGSLSHHHFAITAARKRTFGLVCCGSGRCTRP